MGFVKHPIWFLFVVLLAIQFGDSADTVTCNLDDQSCVVNAQNCTDNAATNTTTCECAEGYNSVNGTCVDRDECEDTDVCGDFANCTNTDGGYNCTCADGYEEADDGDCAALDPCLEVPPVCGDGGVCHGQSNGTYICACKEGYKEYQGGCKRNFLPIIIGVNVGLGFLLLLFIAICCCCCGCCSKKGSGPKDGCANCQEGCGACCTGCIGACCECCCGSCCGGGGDNAAAGANDQFSSYVAAGQAMRTPDQMYAGDPSNETPLYPNLPQQPPMAQQQPMMQQPTIQQPMMQQSMMQQPMMQQPMMQQPMMQQPMMQPQSMPQQPMPVSAAMQYSMPATSSAPAQQQRVPPQPVRFVHNGAVPEHQQQMQFQSAPQQQFQQMPIPQQLPRTNNLPQSQMAWTNQSVFAGKPAARMNPRPMANAMNGGMQSPFRYGVYL